jgi:hypothetical protein
MPVEFEGAPRHIVGKSAYACLLGAPAVVLCVFPVSLWSGDFHYSGVFALLKEGVLSTLLLAGISFILAALFIAPVLALLRRFNLAGPSTVWVVALLPSFGFIGPYELRL